MLKRLKVKFVCVNMLLVVVMLAIIFGLIYKFTESQIEEQAIRIMRSITDHPEQQENSGRPKKTRAPYFILWQEEGELRAKGEELVDLNDPALLQWLAGECGEPADQSGVIAKYSLRYYRDKSPEGEKLVFIDASKDIETMRSLVRTCVLIGIASLAAFLLISVLLARWAIRPVETAWQQQKQFVSDASHELKTPLTIILTNAELLQDTCGREGMQYARNILTVSHQMRALVENLLDMARTDTGRMNMDFQPVAFSQLVSDALLLFEPVFYEQKLTLESAIEENITVPGSEQHLRQVVNILLDNAAKYTAETGSVKVILQRAGHGRCRLTVSTTGEPMTKEELRDIFLRFFRIDKARSERKGYGLGLPIAEGLVKAHRGKIWAESGEGTNRFYILLPVVG